MITQVVFLPIYSSYFYCLKLGKEKKLILQHKVWLSGQWRGANLGDQGLDKNTRWFLPICICPSLGKESYSVPVLDGGSKYLVNSQGAR